jgi:predicted Rossmann fold nucleotide-binding protein DprA/Smf involved in DNA uptake
MSLSRRTFTLLLATTPGIGGRSVTRVLARNDLLNRSPEEFLRLSEDSMAKEYRLSKKAIEGLTRGKADLIKRIQALEDRLGTLGVTVVTAADVHYPQLIEEMDENPPGVLFLYGNTKLLETKTFCVLSSRNTLPMDLELIEQYTEQGVLNSEVLVTGHDRPEYQRSAVVPLRWGSPRILCLDRGMFNVLGQDLKDEAFRAARLWRYEFDATTDLVVSPFRPDADFVGVNNQVRDRLVGSLSKRLVFVQIAPAGNMEKIARLAIRSGRRVQICDRSPGYRILAEAGAEVLST